MLLLERLRSETEFAHRKLHRLIDADRLANNTCDYAQGLRLYLQAVAPAEQSLRTASKRLVKRGQLPEDWPVRLTKTQWLLDDLACLEKTPEAFHVDGASHSSMSFSDDDQAVLSEVVGTSYVLEGMTLGATRMAGRIYEQLGLDQSNGGRFFYAYGPETGARWKSWRGWVEELTLDETVAIDAAVRTFLRFEQSFSGYVAATEGAVTHE